MANDGTLDNTTAIPEANYVYPQDTGRYRVVAAYHSLGHPFRTQLNGTVNAAQINAPILFTNATLLGSNFFDTNYFPVPNLIDEIDNLYQSLVISVLSNPQFRAVAWAGEPSSSSGTGSPPAGLTFPCYKSAPPRFAYRATELWLIYGAAILATAICIAIAWKAVRDNRGCMQDQRVSSIIAATRGPALDGLDWPTDGISKVPQRVLAMRIAYGAIGEEGGKEDMSGDEENYEEARGNRSVRAPSLSGIRVGFGLEGHVRLRERRVW